MSIQKSAYKDSDSDSDSEVSGVLSEASSVSSYPFRKKDKGMKNVVERKDVFDTQQLEESSKISKNYKKYGTSDRLKMKNWTQLSKTIENNRYHLRSENDETLDLIEPVKGNSKKCNRNPIKQQTERCVQITNNQRESTFKRKRSSPKTQRKRPSSPEETNKKKQKIEIDDFFQNASIFQMVVTVKGLDRQNQRMRDLKKPGTMIEEEKIKGIARLQREVEGIPQIPLPRRRKAKNK